MVMPHQWKFLFYSETIKYVILIHTLVAALTRNMGSNGVFVLEVKMQTKGCYYQSE
jgi:hypothetical protein